MKLKYIMIKVRRTECSILHAFVLFYANLPDVRGTREDTEEEGFGGHPADRQHGSACHAVVVLVMDSTSQAKVSNLDAHSHGN